MTREELKKQLNSYRALKAEHKELLEELQHMEERITSPGGRGLDDMPKSPSFNNRTENMIVQHLALQERYRAQLEDLAAAQLAIEQLIEILEPTERRLARLRYIEGLAWEEVCVRMNYSWRQAHRIHSRLLDVLLAHVNQAAL